MDVSKYLEQRRQRDLATPRFREICDRCRQPGFSCYCRHIRPFDCNIQFVILIQHLEFRRRIATGRLSHLCLKNSQLVRGYDYNENTKINQILNDPQNHCVILYPGRNSINLSKQSQEEKGKLIPAGKKLVVLVLDGTWSTAKKMLNRSKNLQKVSQICFTPTTPSRFRVRKQPKPLCYSSVEAIHETIELLGPTCGFDTQSRLHDNLLFVFDQMVEQQLKYVQKSIEQNRHSRHQRKPS